MYLKKTLLAAAIAANTFATFSAFAAQQVDLLITDATLLTMNESKQTFDNGVVAIKGNKIVAVGDQSIAKDFSA